MVVLLVLVLATGVVLPRVAARAALGDASATYQANGVTFQYPAEWRDATDDIGRAVPEDELWFIALHATETDGVGIAALPAGGTPVRADDLDAVKDVTAPVFRELYELRGGSIREGPEETTVAGQPALRYHGDEVIGGTRVESTRVQVFGTTEEILVT